MGTRRGKRGKWFEKVITNVNTMYKRRNIAIIDKIATPINYNTRTGKAFYEGKSTVDFIGCKASGQMVAFDTKEVEGKSFPFKNAGDHQIRYLLDTHNMNCDSFLLIFFKYNQTCYKLRIEDYIRYKNNTDRKSIPYDWFVDNAELVVSNEGLAFDYL